MLVLPILGRDVRAGFIRTEVKEVMSAPSSCFDSSRGVTFAVAGALETFLPAKLATPVPGLSSGVYISERVLFLCRRVGLLLDGNVFEGAAGGLNRAGE